MRKLTAKQEKYLKHAKRVALPVIKTDEARHRRLSDNEKRFLEEHNIAARVVQKKRKLQVPADAPQCAPFDGFAPHVVDPYNAPLRSLQAYDPTMMLDMPPPIMNGNAACSGGTDITCPTQKKGKAALTFPEFLMDRFGGGRFYDWKMNHPDHQCVKWAGPEGWLEFPEACAMPYDVTNDDVWMQCEMNKLGRAWRRSDFAPKFADLGLNWLRNGSYVAPAHNWDSAYWSAPIDLDAWMGDKFYYEFALMDDTVVDENCIRQAALAVGKMYPGARVCKDVSADGVTCDRYLDEDDWGWSHCSGHTPISWWDYETEEMVMWDPSEHCLADCSRRENLKYCSTGIEFDMPPPPGVADKPHAGNYGIGIWNATAYPEARAVWQTALYDCMLHKSECHRSLNEEWSKMTESSPPEDPAAMEAYGAAVASGNSAGGEGDEVFMDAAFMDMMMPMRFRGLSTTTDHSNQHKPVSAHQRVLAEKHRELAQLKKSSKVSPRVLTKRQRTLQQSVKVNKGINARRGRGRGRHARRTRAARKLSHAKSVRALRISRKDVRKLSGRDRRRLHSRDLHTKVRRTSVVRQLSEISQKSNVITHALNRLLTEANSDKTHDSRVRLLLMAGKKEDARRLTQTKRMLLAGPENLVAGKDTKIAAQPERFELDELETTRVRRALTYMQFNQQVAPLFKKGFAGIEEFISHV
jgi:hypothetical protein